MERSLLANRALQLTLLYLSVLVLPTIGIAYAFCTECPYPPAEPGSVWDRSRPPAGVVKYLQDELAIGPDGRFRGSVANIVGMPGGELMRRMGVAEDVPVLLGTHGDRLAYYFRSFDPHFSMTGFWELRIPTLEDDSQVVTPPFYFLVSRALMRPQDNHALDWQVFSVARPCAHGRPRRGS